MLTVYNLSRKVPNRTLFSGFDLSASAGGIVVLSGPSGIGKTQLLRALACLDPRNPEAELTLDNKKPEGYGYPGWRARVAYVYQGRVSLKGTVREHFEKVRNFAAHKERLDKDQGTVEELQELFSKVGLGSDLSTTSFSSTPEKNEDFLERHWQDLSGGEFQRALLCCCLALKPQVLLLDEPTSACDPVSTRAVEELLLSSNATLIVVTHDAEQADRLKAAAAGRPGGLQSVTIESGLE